VNNLIVDAQEVNMVWCGDCLDELVVVHNTIYIPANAPCGEMSGIKTAMVRERVIVRDNIIVNTGTPFIGSSPDTMSLESDFNLFYHHRTVRAPDEFRYGSRVGKRDRVTRAQWLGLGRDRHSVFDRAPIFQDPPQNGDLETNQWGFRVPISVAEARSWFFLRAGSPGVRAASDRSDIGISRSSSSPASPARSGRRATAPSTPQALRLE
jgi:hypothetical protein